jgi:hypothetical protein
MTAVTNTEKTVALNANPVLTLIAKNAQTLLTPVLNVTLIKSLIPTPTTTVLINVKRDTIPTLVVFVLNAPLFAELVMMLILATHVSLDTV